MKCTKCGHNISNKQAFCSVCGAEAPGLPHKKPFPFKIILCVALVFSVIVNILLILLSSFSSPQIEGKGFSSPEAAIMAYIEAFRKGDVDKVISTFAIESYIECFSLENYMREYNGVLIDNNILLPNSNAHTESINKFGRLYEVSRCVRLGYLDLIGVQYNTPYHLRNDNQSIEDLMEQLHASDFEKKLSQLKIGDILTKEYFDYDQDTYNRVINPMRSYLNVTDLCDVAIEFEIGGEEYYLFMLTANINGKWYNISTASPLWWVVEDTSGPSGGFQKR